MIDLVVPATHSAVVKFCIAVFVFACANKHKDIKSITLFWIFPFKKLIPFQLNNNYPLTTHE